ncbi:hypothetical protein DFH09DRAFT_1318350 [Mycena vulgaris]|nr:hypothetical protein DFH09DRAFT_1318350 [Mycena vulgaris]
MPSFSQITLLATVAFAALSAAAPIAPKRELVALPAILTQLVADLTPVTTLLSSIDISNATAEVVTPLTDEIQSIISAAVTEVNALAGSPVSTILATADGVLSVVETGQLLAPVLSIVSAAVGEVLTVVDSTPAGAIIQPLLNDVTGVLGTLLSTAAPLVNGLLDVVVPLVQPVIATLDNLGLGPVVGLLGSIL